MILVVTRKMWPYVENKLGIHNSNDSSLQLRLNEWWMVRFRSPCYKTLLIVIHICICWDLWINRCFGKFEGFMVERVEKWTYSFFSVSYQAVQQLGNVALQVPKVWVEPLHGRYKINSDGCSKGIGIPVRVGEVVFSDQIMVAFCLWAQGNFIMGFKPTWLLRIEPCFKFV